MSTNFSMANQYFDSRIDTPDNLNFYCIGNYLRLNIDNKNQVLQ